MKNKTALQKAYDKLLDSAAKFETEFIQTDLTENEENVTRLNLLQSAVVKLHKIVYPQ